MHRWICRMSRLTVKTNLVRIVGETKVTGLSAIGEPIPCLSGNCTLVRIQPLVSILHLKGRFHQQRRTAPDYLVSGRWRNAVAEDLTKRTLFLVRHAKSSWDNVALPDKERPLADSRKRDAPMMGKPLAKRQVKPDLCYRSRPASCQAFLTGDSRYSSTVRSPNRISALVCIPAESTKRSPSISRFIPLSATSAL